jgi:predicted nuclease of predicted toxin-antitoxin system
MVRLYANENFPLDVVQVLRELGHDVQTTAESGFAGQGTPDEQVLATAISADRIVITHNRRHFIRLHSRNPEHAGIIVCTADTDFESLAGRIDVELRTKSDWHGQLGRVQRPAV